MLRLRLQARLRVLGLSRRLGTEVAANYAPLGANAAAITVSAVHKEVIGLRVVADGRRSGRSPRTPASGMINADQAISHFIGQQYRVHLPEMPDGRLRSLQRTAAGDVAAMLGDRLLA